MRTARAALAAAAMCLVVGKAVYAHPVPFSYIDARVQPASIELAVVAHVFDLAHDLGLEPPEALLDPETLSANADAMIALLRDRVQLFNQGAPLAAGAWSAPEALPERQSIRLGVRYDLPAPPGRIDISTWMFPYDPEHRTFVNIYEGGQIAAQAILDANTTRLEYFAGTPQGRWAVLEKFIPAGVHHILIGPDHLLFLAGLLLLGGSMRQLLLIVTAFTIAHSITLSLAALRLLIPPANAIEPAIALSVVYVGADNLLVRGGGRDTRAWIAFAFGLIHGFGFANVLRDMELPSRALGWTLFGFNLGVEIGQLVVVVIVASVFVWIRSYSERAGRRLAVAGSIVVMLSGVFWFIQRVFFSGGTA